MDVARSALAIALAGAASLHGNLSARTPPRTWLDANGYSWTEDHRSAEQSGLADRTARKGRTTARGSLRFGPFVVLNPSRALLTGATDGASPSHFAAMRAEFPRIAILEMRDCPGTHDDVANLRLGRMIRASGISTVVPRHGSVRSGAVDLFIAGRTRKAANDADFGVHAWQDQRGLGPHDFLTNDRSNQMYLDYYAQMGMSHGGATAFYNLTNAASNDSVIWLAREDLGRFIRVESQ
ncbi:hypothetical protein [Novosphingobium sp. PASSN1]|uniref:hypothetical protein n=1 Tax=Novosphingobium sp. PASSN1 TaxID=2015561 RepID=UPI0025D4DD2A|nr:hypothetical protein [Novosphingobium sp. PASSN1]